MRSIWILFGLLTAIPLGALTWIYSQVDANFLLDTASDVLEEKGISLTHKGEATFSLLPTAHLFLSEATIIIPESETSEAQRIALRGFELRTSLFTFWTSRSAHISAQRLILNNIEMSDFSSPIAVNDSVTLQDISATLWQGKVEGFAQIDTQTQPLTIETRGKLIDADAISMLTAMAEVGGANGTLSAAWNVTAILPPSDKDIAKLNGDIKITGDQVTLTAVDLQRDMCSAINRAQGKRDLTRNESGTLFERLELTQTFVGTETKIDSLILETNALFIEATAKLDRATDGFSAKAAAKLNTEALGSVPNCRINPRLTDISWPIDCRGSLSDGNPRRWCKVDVSEVLEQGLKGELKRRLNVDSPASLIQSLIKRN